MSKKIKGSYLLNAVGVALVFALLTGLFAANAFGTSTTYIQGICTTACYTIIMVTSLNLVVGFMGEFSLGHAGFVSVGAYVSAIVSGALAGKGLSDLGLFLIALLVGGLAAGIMGVLVGIPALRLRGDYLAIVTMAFAEIIRVCFCNFSITGGGKTMSGILKLSTFPRVFWIMVVCVTIMYLFVRSKYGRTVQAIREDYIAASASGINVTYYKVMTFAISAFFAGIGGGIYAHYMTAMIPTNFNFNYSAELLSEVIIGGTGSGKSTLVQLLLGFRMPTSGEVRMDGMPTQTLSRRTMRDNISCVLQNATIYSGTIRDNVRMGRLEAGDVEIREALEIAQAGEFVNGFSDGIDHMIRQSGKNLSGGQKQRLSIARALLKNAPIYIFDDSFSALDFLTEAKLRATLNQNLAGKTQLIITQRVTSAMHCNVIFVMDGGALVDSGTHAQLLERCGVYREIYASQTGGNLNA